MGQLHPLKKTPKHLGLLLHNIICYLASLPNFKVTIKVMVKFSTGTTHFINLTGTVLRDCVNPTTICKTQILSCDSQGTNKKTNISPCQIQKKAKFKQSYIARTQFVLPATHSSVSGKVYHFSEIQLQNSLKSKQFHDLQDTSSVPQRWWPHICLQ